MPTQQTITAIVAVAVGLLVGWYAIPHLVFNLVKLSGYAWRRGNQIFEDQQTQKKGKDENGKG